MNTPSLKLSAVLLLASTVAVWAATNAVPVHSPLRAGDSKSYPHTGEPLSVSPLTWSHAALVTAVLRYRAKWAELG